MPLIELIAVQKEYRLGLTQVIALKQIDLSIEHGEFIAVWGPSGSGKSTLCNLIGLTDSPTSGTLKLESRDTGSLNDDQRSDMRNKQFGFIFQNFNLIPVLTALDNVALPLQIQGLAGKQSRKQAEKLLAELGLEQHTRHRPNKLSGGQQQRVAIARALITHPALVIADEPTANLDSANAIKIIDIMRETNHRNGTTFIFSTHDQRLLSRVQRKIHLQDGRITADNQETYNDDLG
jgi:putative ABC transport system ATP-binding protein